MGLILSLLKFFIIKDTFLSKYLNSFYLLFFIAILLFLDLTDPTWNALDTGLESGVIVNVVASFPGILPSSCTLVTLEEERI